MKVRFISPKADKPTVEKGWQLNYSAAKRHAKKLRWYLLLTILLAPIVFLAWYGLREWLVVEAPGIITFEPIEIRSPGAGQVSKRFPKPGQPLAIGDPILSLRSETIEAEIQALEQQLALLSVDLQQEQRQGLQALNQQVNEARGGVAKQGKVLEELKTFNGKRVINTLELATAYGSYTSAKLQLGNAELAVAREQERQKEHLIAGPQAKQIRAIQLALEVAKAKRRQLQIEAPGEYRLLQWQVEEGEWVTEGQPLAVVAPIKPPHIVAYLKPADIDYARIGNTATVFLPNNKQFSAEVYLPPQITNELPSRLLAPFSGEKSTLQVKLSFDHETWQAYATEALPVRVRFHFESEMSLRQSKDEASVAARHLMQSFTGQP